MARVPRPGCCHQDGDRRCRIDARAQREGAPLVIQPRRRKWQENNGLRCQGRRHKSLPGKHLSFDAWNRRRRGLRKCNNRACFVADCGPCLLRQIVDP
jgi:hypothetical protein